MLDKNNDMTRVSSSLKDLKKAMLVDSRLVNSTLGKSATQLVFGCGNETAEIVFVGEAPGRQEDQQGRPFVGAAGQFLNQCLQKCRLNLADVWVTNLVKYRPPQNRDPYPLEKKLHAPYLRQELALIRPKTIVTLGLHAGTYFAKRLNLKEQHGQTVDHYRDSRADVDARVIAFYHPAAALYNPTFKELILNDFMKVFGK